MKDGALAHIPEHDFGSFGDGEDVVVVVHVHDILSRLPMPIVTVRIETIRHFPTFTVVNDNYRLGFPLRK